MLIFVLKFRFLGSVWFNGGEGSDFNVGEGKGGEGIF
jgi:hypothetical protein